MPIVGDEVYDYTSGMDITTLQVPRATESAMYDYIIEECKTIAEMLPTEPSKNGARATKWAAKMLEARAAVYAGSIARYNTVSDYPLLNPETGVVGISSEKATDYYKKALTAAEEVINSGKYSLMRVADDATPQEKADNFFKAVCEKMVIQKSFGHVIIFIRDKLMVIPSLYSLMMVPKMEGIAVCLHC